MGFFLFLARIFDCRFDPQKDTSYPPLGEVGSSPWEGGLGQWGDPRPKKKYLVGWTLLGRKICSGGSTGKFTKFEVNKSSFPEVCPLWNPTLNLEAWINKHTYLVKAQIYPRHDIFTDIQRDRKICAWGMLSHLDTC